MTVEHNSKHKPESDALADRSGCFPTSLYVLVHWKEVSRRAHVINEFENARHDPSIFHQKFVGLLAKEAVTLSPIEIRRIYRYMAPLLLEQSVREEANQWCKSIGLNEMKDRKVYSDNQTFLDFYKWGLERSQPEKASYRFTTSNDIWPASVLIPHWLNFDENILPYAAGWSSVDGTRRHAEIPRIAEGYLRSAAHYHRLAKLFTEIPHPDADTILIKGKADELLTKCAVWLAVEPRDLRLSGLKVLFGETYHLNDRVISDETMEAFKYWYCKYASTLQGDRTVVRTRNIIENKLDGFTVNLSRCLPIDQKTIEKVTQRVRSGYGIKPV